MKSKKRVCVIGLDGMPYSLLRHFAAKGIMSEMRQLINQGNLVRMKVTLPEISAVSWSSFMTGVNPGTHGIFGFTDLKVGSYSIKLPNFKDLKVPTIWDKLGESSLKSIVINQPSTYPARYINGILISGFVAIDLEKAVYPPHYRVLLEKLGYEIDIDTYKAREDPDYCLNAVEKCLVGREKVAKYLFNNEEWDYFQLVITGTDRLQHYLWYALEDENDPRHQRIINFYNQIDKLIGSFFSMFKKLSDGNIENFFMLSDHGFTGIKKEVQLNAWLKQNNYLRFETENPESLEQIATGTKAFALDPGRIYINYKYKYPRGCVEGKSAEAIKSEIKNKLIELEYKGEKVIESVFEREEIYSGLSIADAPDLIVLSKYGFDLKASVKEKQIFGNSVIQGMHTWDDAFFLAFCDLPQNLHIVDIRKILESKLIT